jgi:hypothetical protein
VHIDLSIAALDIAALDNASRDLRFRFGNASQHPPLFTLTNQRADAAANETILVHVLGGSHRVEFTRDQTTIIEEVACETSSERGTSIVPLPASWTKDKYQFKSIVRILSPQKLSDVASHLRATLTNDVNAIVAQFPGHPDALTAVQIRCVEKRVVGWYTWHLYPNAHEVVETSSTITSEIRPEIRPTMTPIVAPTMIGLTSNDWCGEQ